MQPAPIPDDEAWRLASLRRTGLLDSAPEPEFDEIVELAGLICDAPVALVSLVDGDRQWFKAKVGLDAEQTPRDVAFCAHAILEPSETFAVPDAERDPRFHDNPLVTGGPRVKAYFGRPLRSVEGAAIGTLCVIDHRPRELSDVQRRALEILARRVETELALRASRDAAVAAESAKSQFLATMSHEIRTPLNGLLGTLELVLDEPLEPRQRRDLETALGSGRLLRGLLNSVLDLSKAGQGTLDLRPTPVRLRALIDQAVGSFEAGARMRGSSLSIAVAPDVPDFVAADAARLAQVLGNLVGNAVKFTERGRVEVRLERAGSRLAFGVHDTGAGIAAADLERVLERFEQADGARGGTGLGLSLARDLVRLMGGELRLASEPGRGTSVTFELELPVLEGASESIAPELPSLAGRVLIVDDEPLNLKVGGRTLARLGLEVATAANGPEALARLAEEDCDLVLLDYQMPGMDGPEVAERIRRGVPGGAGLPILSLTASATPEVRARCLAAGMDEVLEKPIERALLAEALRRWLPHGSRRDAS